MTTVPGQALRAGPAAALFVRVLLWVAAARILVAVAAGFIALAQHEFPVGLARAGDVLSTFGSASQALGVPMLLVAVALLWWQHAGGTVDDEVSRRRWRAACVAAWWLLALTAVSAVLVIVGVSLEAASFGLVSGWRAEQIAGFAAGDAVVCLAASAFVRVLLSRAAVAATGEAARAVFAVDRKSKDVLAWPSFAEALVNAPVYGVEDEEYDFFLDDGRQLDASIEDDRVRLTTTDTDRRDELVDALKAFAARHELSVPAADVDEPLAYVDPVNRWHWLALWPAWTRWIGHVVRPPR